MSETAISLEALSQIMGSTLRVATPLIFAALGGFFAEKSGVVDIGLEGKMVLGACVAAVVSHATGSPYLGFIAGGLAGMILGGFYGIFSVTLNADQIVTGTALNLLAAGLVPFALNLAYGTPGSSPSLDISERFVNQPLLMVWITVAAVALWFKYGRSGLWLRFAGEHPAALATSGVSVFKTRYFALLTGGFLAGAGGATLSLFLASSFSRNMTAGRGYMALAALILGNWKPFPTAFACLLFGLVDALQIRFQLGGFIASGKLSFLGPLVETLPYIVTIVIVAGFFAKSRAPSSLGKSWNSSKS